MKTTQKEQITQRPFKIENRNICRDDMSFRARLAGDGSGVTLIPFILVVLCSICVHENKLIHDCSAVW